MNWIGAFAVCLLSLSAFAKSVAPRSLRVDPPTLSWQILGPTCQAFRETPDSLPCNPAFLSQESSGTLRGGLQISDNVKYWNQAQKLVAGSADREAIQSLFRQSEDSSLSASLETSYARTYWGLAVTPYRLGYFSNIQNPSLPLIETLIFQEQNVRLQLGSFIQGPWSWGLETRVFRRQVISQKFFLTDLFVENGTDRLRPEDQNGVYLEPTLLYEFENSDWNPLATIAVTQWGYVDRKIDDFPMSPAFTLAGSVQPEVTYGHIQLGLAFHYHSELEKTLDILQGSLAYRLGFAQYLIGLSTNRQALGYNLSFHGFQAALEYAHEVNLNRLVAIQLGFEF